MTPRIDEAVADRLDRVFRRVSDSQYRCSRMVKSCLSHRYPAISASFFLNSIASHFSSYPAWVTLIPARNVGSTTPFW